MYSITKNFLSDIPNLPYRNGVGAYEGVVLHATANYGSGPQEDTDEGERNYEQDTWNNAFVHSFIDYDSITQVADLNYKAWGAGPKANERFVHIELCQTKDPNRFKESYSRWVYFAAYVLFQRNLGVSPAKADLTGTVWSHKDVTTFYPGTTTHEDPIDYLATFGKTWDNVLNDVLYCYNQLGVQSQVDQTQAAIQKLQAAGVITSPDYWLQNAVPGGSCKGEYVATLLKRLAERV